MNIEEIKKEKDEMFSSLAILDTIQKHYHLAVFLGQTRRMEFDDLINKQKVEAEGRLKVLQRVENVLNEKK